MECKMENEWQEIQNFFSFTSAPIRVDVRYSDGREFWFNYPDQLISTIEYGVENPIVNWPHIEDRRDAYITHVRFGKR